MRRGDPERIYVAQRAGFVEAVVSRNEASRERVEAVLVALEADCAVLGLVRGSPEFWREAERRAGVIRAQRPCPSHSASPRPSQSSH